jgi:hypothetical protein
MVKSEHEVELRFSQPIRQVLLMLSVLVLTSFGTVVAAPRVMAVFTANLWLNGFILFVFFVGLISCFVQVVQLIKSVRWIEEFVNKTDKGAVKAPQLLGPISSLITITRNEYSNIIFVLSVNFGVCVYSS